MGAKAKKTGAEERRAIELKKAFMMVRAVLDQIDLIEEQRFFTDSEYVLKLYSEMGTYEEIERMFEDQNWDIAKIMHSVADPTLEPETGEVYFGLSHPTEKFTKLLISDEEFFEKHKKSRSDYAKIADKATKRIAAKLDSILASGPK